MSERVGNPSDKAQFLKMATMCLRLAEFAEKNEGPDKWFDWRARHGRSRCCCLRLIGSVSLTPRHKLDTSRRARQTQFPECLKF